MLYIYTDGSCNVLKRIGGWAFIVIFKDHTFETGERVLNTTNNRIELEAVLKPLEFFIKDDITFYSDSKYVIGCAIEGHNRNKNKDMWKRYDKLIKGRKIYFVKVKAHSTCKYNNMVNDLAIAYRKGKIRD